MAPTRFFAYICPARPPLALFLREVVLVGTPPVPFMLGDGQLVPRVHGRRHKEDGHSRGHRASRPVRTETILFANIAGPETHE